ncbi:MAG: NADH-quinone oxidoreductase subunit NuoG [Actinomycetota bacterium]|nr:NADH-quinone oxidoreductase subunit NuoG [Actinomycetota bacterium]
MTTTQGTPAEQEVDLNAVPITINGRAITARKGEYVIAAAERHDVFIPRFCYHERMSSVGMCRMCLVEIDTGRGPMLQPSCMVSVAPDMKVETESPASKRAQEGIIELLLAQHPLDCPVCDKGGECPLQDQSFSHGPGESRYVEEKRHYEKPIPISDLVLLDRERCILCDRCTRFADEVAGDPLIHFTERGNETQVMTFPDEPFSSYFSGNTVQICPVSALTASPYRFKARPWDLAESESTCTACSVGCQITVQSSRDELVRYLGVDSDPVNWGWLCDKGRFGFEATNSKDRLTVPLVKGPLPDGTDGFAETSWGTAIAAVAGALRDTLEGNGAQRVAILGGARGTNEDAYAWAQLAGALGVVNRDAQLGDGLPAEVLDLPRATIDETTAAPTIILVGPDPKEELGVLYLRLRHTIEKRTSKLIELTPTATGLTRKAWRSVRVEAGGAAVAAAALDDPIVQDQLRSGPVVIVAGRANVAESAVSAVSTLRAVYDAVAAVQPDVAVLPALRRANVTGALQLGLGPQRGGSDAVGILNAAAAGSIDVLVLLGADPISDFPDALLARKAIEAARVVVAIDGFLTESSSQADVILPAALFGEKSGTTTNLEGRVTTVAQRVTPAGTSRADWMIASELADALGHDELATALSSVESITDAIAASVPAYAGATKAALDGNREGVLAVTGPAGIEAIDVVTVTERNSYDYRLVVSRTMYDQAVGTVKSPSLAVLAVNVAAFVNPADADKIGVSEGGEVRITGVRGSITLPLHINADVPRGTLLVPYNHVSSGPSTDIRELIDASAAVTDVRIEVGS